MSLENGITYDIPASLIAGFCGQKLIVRARDPAELTRNIADEGPETIYFVKLLSLEGKPDSLLGWRTGLPIELAVSDAYRDLPLLYRFAPLLADHPIRVSVPLVPGFGKVVKLAISLNFAVKLGGGQPDASLLDEMRRTALFYLHQPMVAEPIEFFHSLFLAFYHRRPITLWTIQEEDPSLVRYISGGGKEMMPGRLAGMAVDESFSFTLETENECAGCEFLLHCHGYFKWPRREYSCNGVKALLHTLRSGADELRTHLASCHFPGEGGGT